MTESNIGVGLGEIKLVRDRRSVLVCYGLGSCVGVAAYDRESGVGGMIHVVMPESSIARDGDGEGKFADTGLPRLLQRLEAAGGKKQRLEIKLAGGAQMLMLPTGGAWDVGQRNVEAVKATLERLGLKVSGSDLGGNYGRTMRLYTDSGRVVVSSIGRDDRQL